MYKMGLSCLRQKDSYNKETQSTSPVSQSKTASKYSVTTQTYQISRDQKLNFNQCLGLTL